MMIKSKLSVSEQPFVSVILLSYNAEKFIKATIYSIFNQTYDNYELIAIDNNSTDGTREILKTYQKAHSKKMKLILNKSNLGLPSAYNIALAECKGKYVAIIEHDDLWHADKLWKQVKFMEKTPGIAGVGTWVYEYWEGFKIFIGNMDEKRPKFVAHQSLLFRNTGVRYNKNVKWIADYCLEKELLRSGGLACLQEYLTIRRMRNDASNVSLKFRLQLLEEKIRYEKEWNEKIKTYSLIFINRLVPQWIRMWIRKRRILNSKRRYDIKTVEKEFGTELVTRLQGIDD